MKIKNKHDYGLWFTATTADMFGRSAQDLTLPFIIVAFSGSTAIAGNIQTVGKIVSLAVILFGGVLIDRIDRRSWNVSAQFQRCAPVGIIRSFNPD